MIHRTDNKLWQFVKRYFSSICLLAFILSFASQGTSQEPPADDNWINYVDSNFRKGHNISVLSGIRSGSWFIKKFGYISNQTYDFIGYNTKLYYSFHIPFASSSFGYFLGTSFGIADDIIRNTDIFRSFFQYHLPSFYYGIVWDIDTSKRLFFANDHYLEYAAEISDHSTKPYLALSTHLATIFDFMLGFDYFYYLAWAYRLNLSFRYTEFTQPKEASGHRLTGSEFSRLDWGINMGLTYHLL